MAAPAAVHPSDQTLQSYGLGKLDDLLAEAVGKHLKECDPCRRRVAEVTSDSFVGRLRDAQARPESVPPVGSSLEGWSKLGEESRTPSPPPASTLPPGLAEHPDYQVLRELGRGGMGVVYLAENRMMGRKEVLKVVSSHLLNHKGVLERFLREIRSAAQLHHPNIITAYSATRVGESIVFSMQYVEGYDLSQLVEKSGPLSVAHACNFVYQAALGLQHAHEHGMVHRDIKPSNLMLARDGNKPVVKVLDFGLAKVTSEGAVDGGLTHEGQMLGTPHYIAPEQTVSPQKADIRADIYSLGCTLYCLLTGHPPFDAPSLYELLQAHHSMDAKPLNFIRPEVPVELAAVVAKMLAKEPERRFQTHAEVAEALKPFFRKDGVNSKALKPEVSQVGLVDPKQEPVKVPTPATQPQPKADANPAPGQTAAGSRAEPKWESLIDIKETEDAQDVVAVVFQPKRQWPRWFWPAIAGAFSFAMIALGIVIYFTTDKGRIKVDLGDGKTPVKVEPGGGVVVEFEPAAKDRTLANQNTSTTKNAEIAATAKSDEPITNSIGMKLVLIPAGDFFMGSPEGDIEARGEEKPAHRVRISKPFYLGVYEVTQAQYEAVMRYNPSHFSSNGGGKDLVAGQSTDRYPVENVPWLDAVTFCNKLSEREGRKSSYEIDGENVRVPDRNGSGYRLPTEAEWEYACRANASTPTRYSFGDDAAELGEYGWFYGHSDARTHLVGQKKPNGFGLYDMHGNVWEWCWDWYSAGYYKQSPADDPTGSEPASLRVRRGGSWGHEPRWCRSAFRSQVGPGVRDRKQGFRLALYPSDKIKDQSGNMSPGLPLSNESKTAQPLGVEKLVTPRTEGPKPTPSGIESKPTLRPRGDWTSPTTKRDCSIATGADSKIARQEQGESTWDPLNASELAPNSANGLMPSLIAWAKSQPPGNVAIVSTKMEFVRIKAGEFIMGSPEPDAPPEQKPQHKVRISPFYLGIYEVTQAQYQAAMGNIPSYFSSTGGGKDKVAGRSTDQYPVEGVSWLDAVRFCNALSKKDGLTPFYEVNGRNVAIPARKGSGYRLPTEAEWEYACRAGTTTKYSFGNNPFLLGDYGWFDQNSMRMSHPVGEKHPNEFGLYDMHGNVFERCSDTYTNDYNKGAPESDPLGLPSVADLAVIRGGSWRRGERSCWSAYRYGYTQTGRQPDLGFRVALGQSGP